MADEQIKSTDSPAAPQAFNFAHRDLSGRLLGFTGAAPRPFVVHQFPKRKGAKVEDMEQAPQRLTVRLIFAGSSCAADYQEFKAAVATVPTGLLIHPIAGQWFAFCEGPDERVDFTASADSIEVNCSWTESNIDATIEPDVPNVATAASSDSIATLLGVVQSSAEDLEEALIAASPTNAGAADAFAEVELMVDACLTLSEAVQAALPPTITVVVPSDTNLIVFAQQLILQFGADVDAATYASAIMGLNRIPNPANIEGGTELDVPSLQ